VQGKHEEGAKDAGASMRFSGVLVVCIVCLAPGIAQGEKYEKRVTLSGLMGVPVAKNPGGFLLGWGGSGGFEYSPLHELWVGAEMSISQFPGATPDYSTTIEGRSYTGTLTFSGQYYHPQLTARYELLSGWPVAPHLQVAVGYMHSTYGTASLVDDDNNLVVDAELPADSGGGLSLEAALIVNVRIIDMLQIGTGVAYLHVFDEHYRGAVLVPLQLSFYWY